MSSDDINSAYNLKVEERTRNLEKWKVKKMKLVRQVGKSYISTSGKFVEQQRLDPMHVSFYFSLLFLTG